MKTCTKCKETKPLVDFHKSLTRPDKLQADCKKCNSEKWYKYAYGISFSEKQKIVESQNNCCAICNKSFADLHNRHVHLDHCHETGKIRGVLCGNCNKGLGCFLDSLELLESAKGYLKKHE
jgi:hypothetical protein